MTHRRIPKPDHGTAPADDDLLALYAQGDPRAARMLADRHAPALLGYARRMLHGDGAEAEDVVQEAMMRLWRIAPHWETGRARVGTWLYRVATNLCIDRLRRSPQAALDSIPEPADGRPPPETALMQATRSAALQTALDTLPARQRQAVILRHFEGMANPDIGTIMDIGVEAVESLLSRGKRALAAALSGRRKTLGYDDDTP
jgi:RNA polymerase sigma-70 factor (ECF subfamily)